VPASLEDLSPEQKQELNLGRLTKQLLQNPETAETAQRLLMKGDSKLRFPEVTLKDSLSKVREETAEETKELREQVKRLEAERKLEKLHAKVTTAGLELKPVVDLMEKHGLAPTEANYDMAIEVLQTRAALAEPTTSSGVQPLEMPNIKEMWQDPVQWREREAEKVMREMRGARVQ
jgi:hypothetical protein